MQHDYRVLYNLDIKVILTTFVFLGLVYKTFQQAKGVRTMKKDSVSPEVDSNRRRALIKLGLAAGVVYAAPMVLNLNTAAAKGSPDDSASNSPDDSASNSPDDSASTSPDNSASNSPDDSADSSPT